MGTGVVCLRSIIEFSGGNGAPEEIRTPDPQIRSLRLLFDIAQHFCKLKSIERTGINGLDAILQTE
jgi:hypothetical protein